MLTSKTTLHVAGAVRSTPSPEAVQLLRIFRIENGFVSVPKMVLSGRRLDELGWELTVRTGVPTSFCMPVPSALSLLPQEWRPVVKDCASSTLRHVAVTPGVARKDDAGPRRRPCGKREQTGTGGMAELARRGARQKTED